MSSPRTIHTKTRLLKFIRAKRKKNLSTFCLCTFSGIYLFICISGLCASNTDIKEYLPEAGQLGSWKTDGLPRVFRGEDLFIYINGGAEIYYEYGFRQVLVQDYRNERGREIALEVYEMDGPESAYGMYSFKKSRDGKEMGIGREAQLSDYYLNLWKGRFLITLIGLDEERETIEGLLLIARAVENKIEDKGRKPELLKLLLEKDILSASIKYMKGPLGLFNCYPFFTDDVFAFREGVKGEYGHDEVVFLFDYGDKEECRQRFEKVKEEFDKSIKYDNFKNEETSFFSCRDQKNKIIYGAFFDKYIWIWIGKETSPVEERLSSIRKRIKSNERT